MMSDLNLEKYSSKYFEVVRNEYKREMADLQAVMQAITQTAIKAARAAVKAITEAAQQAEECAGRNVTGNCPRAFNHQEKRNMMN